MDRVLKLSVLVLCLTAAIFLVVLSYSVYQIPGILDRQLTSSRNQVEAMVTHEAAEARKLVDREIGQTLLRVDRATALIDVRSSEALAQTVEVRLSAQAALDKIESDANARLSEVTDSVAEIAKIRQDLSPTIEGLNLLMARNALPAQMLGLVAAGKVTLGETAQAAKEIRISVPNILATVQDIGDQTKIGTERYVKVAEHTDAFIVRMTPPYLPKWARLGIAMAGPLAQTGAAVVGAGAALGAFNKN